MSLHLREIPPPNRTCGPWPSPSQRSSTTPSPTDDLLGISCTRRCPSRGSTDISSTVRDYAENINASPERLAEIEDRLALLDRLKRKYGRTLLQPRRRILADRGSDAHRRLPRADPQRLSRRPGRAREAHQGAARLEAHDRRRMSRRSRRATLLRRPSAHARSGP